MCEDYKCKNCGNNVIYDKKHKRYPKFCSKECRKNYTINHNPHYCVICGELAKYKRWIWKKRSFNSSFFIILIQPLCLFY